MSRWGANSIWRFACVFAYSAFFAGYAYAIDDVGALIEERPQATASIEEQADSSESESREESGQSVPPLDSNAYEDQYLIDDWPDDYPELSEDASFEEQPRGYRSLATDFQLTQREFADNQSQQESSARLRWTRETLNYGHLSFHGGISYLEGSGDALIRSSHNPTGRAVLAQDALPVVSDWYADNTLGVHSSHSSSLIRSGYRVNLPSSLIRGASNTLSNGKQDLSFSAGQVGRFEGLSGLGFNASQAESMVLGYERQHNGNWEYASQALLYRNDDLIPDHRSAAQALRYRSIEDQQEMTLHTLFSDSGHGAGWLDAEKWMAGWQHRFGSFYLDEDLYWGDAQLNDNRAGGYWRANRKTILQTLGAGISYEESNITGDSSLPGSQLVTAFSSLSRRVSGRTRVGGSASLSRYQQGRGKTTPTGESVRLSVFMNRKFKIGQSNIQLQQSKNSFTNFRNDQTVLNWDQEWEQVKRVRLNTSLGLEKFSEAGGDRVRMIGGVTLSQELENNIRFSMAVTRSRDEADINATQLNSLSTSGNLGLYWRPSGIWEWSLQAYINESVQRLDQQQAATATSEQRDSRLVLGLRSFSSGGRSFNTLGLEQGQGGTGAVKGVVFYDSNNNGKRDAGEEVARRLIVYLDGRFATETDNQGAFRFEPVFAGAHKVSLAVEDLPLPWVPQYEDPQVVQVDARGITTMDFPLVRLDQ